MVMRHLQQFSQLSVIWSPRGHVTMSGDNLLSQVGQWGEYYWHLVDRGHRCCQTSHTVQGQAPATNNYPTPNVNNAEEVEKFSSRLIAVQQGETGTSTT